MKIQSNNHSEKSIKILSIEFFRFLYSVIVDQGLPDMQMKRVGHIVSMVACPVYDAVSETLV